VDACLEAAICQH